MQIRQIMSLKQFTQIMAAVWSHFQLRNRNFITISLWEDAT